MLFVSTAEFRLGKIHDQMHISSIFCHFLMSKEGNTFLLLQFFHRLRLFKFKLACIENMYNFEEICAKLDFLE